MKLYPITNLLSDGGILALVACIVAVIASLYIMPEVIKRMKQAKHVAKDINKKHKPNIPEMGGVGLVLSVSLTLTLVGGALVLFDVFESPNTLYVALSVVFITSYIGLFDDIAVIGRKNKAIGLILAGLPLAVSRPVLTIIEIPIIGEFLIYDYYPLYLLFWLLIVPFGILACANAFNMAAGYNGMESGQTAIISFFLMLISIVYGTDIMGILIFAATFGGSVVLYKYNRYPAKTFVGDIGTLSMGALIATGAIFTGLELYAIILILPMFYEAIATGYYSWKKIERRDACMNPIINDDGTICPPEGAEKYTLAFFILSKKPMKEKKLVGTILMIYVILGLLALSLGVITNLL